MRIRFFAIILAVLSIVAVASVQLHAHMVRRERIRLMDQDVRTAATVLLDSSLGEIRKVSFKKMDAIISEELGESRIGKFFVIRNEKGKILYASETARVLPMLTVPQNPQWVTIHQKGQYIRVLNLSLPRIPDRTLQVGAILDDDLLAPSLWSRSNLGFLLAVIVLGLGSAWVLASTLLRPIRKLGQFVSKITPGTSAPTELPPIPTGLRRASLAGRSQADEFHALVRGLDKLIARVNRGYRMSRVWSYQMAHELKTPLSILSIELERNQLAGRVPIELTAVFAVELRKMSDTVSAFLNWAEMEGSKRALPLHAIRMTKTLEALKERLEVQYPGRLRLEARNDIRVFADPQRLELALQNVVTNALKFSSAPVVIRMQGQNVSIIDEGPGFPQEVLECLGEPFNKGQSSGSGHGLGLAWVMSVARSYEWKIAIDSQPGHTEVGFSFPAVEEETSPASEHPAAL